MIQLKRRFFCFFCISILFYGCSSNNEAKIPASNLVNFEETPLPKGKFILQDDNIRSGIIGDTSPGSMNNYNGNNQDSSGISTVHNKEVSKLPANMLKKKFKDLLCFHADDTMLIDKAYIATLVLGKNQKFEVVQRDALESSNATDDKIVFDTSMEIGSKMQARLIDMSSSSDRGFDIELIGGQGSETQSLNAKRSKVYWQWKLTPLTPGLKELKLSINIVEKDGEVVNIPARNIPVVIYGKEGFMYKTGQFFKNEGKWIITAILIPIFIAIVTNRLKNREKKAKI